MFKNVLAEYFMLFLLLYASFFTISK